MYNNPGLPRDIQVAFLGQASGYRSTRMHYMQHLMESNVPIYLSLFNRAEQHGNLQLIPADLAGSGHALEYLLRIASTGIENGQPKVLCIFCRH